MTTEEEPGVTLNWNEREAAWYAIVLKEEREVDAFFILLPKATPRSILVHHALLVSRKRREVKRA